jgi:hypothetical protein
LTFKGSIGAKPNPKTIGLQSLTAKILCKAHNSGLSDLDNAAGTAFDAVRSCRILSNVRKDAPGTRYKVERFTMDAKTSRALDLLKTLLNLSNESSMLIGVNGQAPGIPPADLVRICFGLEPFPVRAGMYHCSKRRDAR